MQLATGTPAGRPTATPTARRRDVRPAAGAPTPRAAYWRRRLAAVAALVALAFAATVLVGRVVAEAELGDPVAGEAVVEPGQSLWDVAVATTPAGVDPRAHLEDIRRLNGFDSAHVEPWTVVAIPAR